MRISPALSIVLTSFFSLQLFTFPAFSAPTEKEQEVVVNIPVSSLTLTEALNQAGRQRMLSQRIAKAYALVGQNVMLSAKTQLFNSVKLFDKQLAALALFATTDEEQTTIAKIEAL